VQNPMTLGEVVVILLTKVGITSFEEVKNLTIPQIEFLLDGYTRLQRKINKEIKNYR